MAATISRKIKISSRIRCRDVLELTYICCARLSGAESIVSEIENGLDKHPYAWIARGTGFVFELHISWPDEFEHTYQEKLLLELTKALQNTQIWNDLSLLASIQRSGYSSITVSLQHDEATLTTGGMTGRPAAGHTSTLRPPRGIPFITLDKVELNLTFTRNMLPDLSKKSLNQHHWTVQSLQETQKDINFVSLEDDMFEDLPVASYHEQSTIGHSDTEMAWSQATNFWQEHSHLSLDDRNGASGSDIDSALQLVDSLLRIDILGAQRSGKTRPIRTENTMTLAKLCPLMFCPSFLKGMNECASLIPSIARSITGIAHRSHSEGLSTKSAEALEADLWKLASTQLYKTRASFKLSPLVEPSKQNETETQSTSAIRHRAVSMDMIDPFDDFHDIQDISDRSENDGGEGLDHFEDLLENDLDRIGDDIDFSALDDDNDNDDECYTFDREIIDLPDNNACGAMTMDYRDRQLEQLVANDIFSDL